MSDRDTTRNISVLYYLNRTCNFHFKWVFIKGFNNDAFIVWLLLIVALLSKIRCALTHNFHTCICLKLSRRICWKHGILLKIKSTTDALIIICRNFSEKHFLRTATNSYFWHLFYWSAYDLNFKWRLKWIKRSYLYSPSVFTYFQLNFKNCNVFICKDTSWTQWSN